MSVHDVHPWDAALRAALPTVLQPRYDVLPPLEIGGRRHVLASNGLFLECRSRGLHAQVRIADFDLSHSPYGEAETFRHFGDGGERKLPEILLADAVAHARATLPNEWAGLILNTMLGPTLHVPKPEQATCGSIRYRWEGIDPLDVVCDLHSHGTGGAYFSATDDADDRANPSPCFVAIVLGKLGEGGYTSASRLVMNGQFFDLRNLAPASSSESLPQRETGGH